MADELLIGIEFLDQNLEEIKPRGVSVQKVIYQLQHYFDDARYPFSLPLNASGSQFQKSVWRMLPDILLGEVCTYGALAKRLSTSARAVGGACRNNPIPIIIPCHRVLAANGWGGFDGQTAGKNIAIKRWLLDHEKKGRKI